MPTHDNPVEVVYPNGRTVRFSRERMTGYWLGVDESGQTLIERDTLADAIELLGKHNGADQDPDVPPQRFVRREDEDGYHWLEQEDEWL